MKMSWTRIKINGVTYGSVDEMPPEVRRQYEEVMARVREDKDGDGVPDILQNGPGGGKPVVVVKQFKTITVNGKSYESLDDVPAEVRGLLDAHTPPFEPQPIFRSSSFGTDSEQMSWSALLFLAATIAIVVAFVGWWVQRK